MAKKKKKARIPKKVAGVKIPKFVRKSDFLGTLLASDIGRDILANALTAAAGAAAAVILEHRDDIASAGKSAARESAKTGSVIGEAAQSAANAAMEVVSEATGAVLPIGDGKGKQASRH
jgi:hypothetical protein